MIKSKAIVSVKPFITVLVAVFLFGFTSFSQTPPTSLQPTEANIVAEYYFVDHNLDKFTGTWRWTSGTDTVIISLKKLKHTYFPDPVLFYQDWLYGCHTYIKNGQLVESTMQNFTSTDLDIFNIVGYSNTSDSTKSDLLFTKSNRQAKYYLTLQYDVGASPEKLIWHTETKYCRDCAQIIKLPKDMVLTKL